MKTNINNKVKSYKTENSFNNLIYLITLFLFFSFQLSTSNCFSQSWQWAKSGGGATSDDGSSVCQDNNGNIYVAGFYNASPYSTTIGIFDSITIPYIGASQIFLVKYSSAGNIIWAKSIGGNDSPDPMPEQPYKVIYEPVSNAIYLSGIYNSTIVLGNDTLTGNGSFISKINTNGNYVWSKKLNVYWAIASASDVSGNIYLDGNCIIATTIDTFSVMKGFFLAKFNSSGNCLKVNSNLKDCNPGNISIKNDNLYFSGTTLNDTIQIDTLVRTFSNSYNGFVAKFNENLQMKWVTFATSTNSSSPTDIGLDSLCNSYIVGQFRTNINFGSLNLTTSGPGDLFIAKYDSNGIFQWARQGYNTTGSVYPVFCKPLNNGDFYIAGPYDGTDLKFGTFTISYVNAYVARYDNAGNALNVITLPGSGYCEGLSVDTSDNFCIIGYFAGTLNIGAYSVTSHGFGDVYVAKHDMITREELKSYNPNNGLVIYANPNAGKCTITIPNEFNTETKLTLQIFDNTGHLLQQTPVEMMQDKVSVNITAEAKGMYTAVLSNGVKSYTGKIIFE